MSEVILQASVTAIIALLSSAIGGYIVMKLAIKKVKDEAPDIILSLIEDLLPELPKIFAKDEVRSFIYSAGALAGNGAKSGFGLGTGKGKMKFEDIIMGVAGQFLPNIAQKVLGAATEAQPQKSDEGKW